MTSQNIVCISKPYKPYSLVNHPNGTIQKTNSITGQKIRCNKIPYRGTSESDLESEINQRHSYLWDAGLIPGCYYAIQGKVLVRVPHDIDEDLLHKILHSGIGAGLPDVESYKQEMTETALTLNEPIPDIRRVAFDIELSAVDGEINVENPIYSVTAVSLSSESESVCYVVEPGGIKHITQGIEVIPCDTEGIMIRKALNHLAQYPVWLSYYGEQFDLPYLHHRCVRLGSSLDDILYNTGGRITPIRQVHVDLYSVYSNPSLQAYAFGGRYDTYSLDAVAFGMLGRHKSGTGEAAGILSGDDLAIYCHTDARLTYDLTTFAESATLNILVIISRISSLPIDVVSQTRVSTWTQSMLNRRHRIKGILIPTKQDIQEKTKMLGVSVAKPIQKNKKYRGGMVMQQTCGLFWNMTVLDYASMYPHIIQLHNISYETIQCPHDSCKEYTIPGTAYWRCTKQNGMLASCIGALRELRVQYYKKLSKNTKISKQRRMLYESVAGAIKVFMNASYGVMGSEFFPLYYLPVADSVTAVGRKMITDTISVCESKGVKVLYGDTDSLFVAHAPLQTLHGIISATLTMHGAELEIDKQYRFALLTGLKKNYLGIRDDGTADVKGLLGKKSDTPQFIRNSFERVVGILCGVSEEAQIESAKGDISDLIKQDVNKIRTGDYTLGDMTYRKKLKQPLNKYSGSPQHVAAAKMLQNVTGINIQEGSVIRFIKTKSGPVPFELASSSQIDTEKYIDALGSVVSQILPPLDMTAEGVITGTTQNSMDNFFAV